MDIKIHGNQPSLGNYVSSSSFHQVVTECLLCAGHSSRCSGSISQAASPQPVLPSRQAITWKFCKENAKLAFLLPAFVTSFPPFLFHFFFNLFWSQVQRIELIIFSISWPIIIIIPHPLLFNSFILFISIFHPHTLYPHRQHDCV